MQSQTVAHLDIVDAGSRQGGFVQVIKVRVSHGLPCRDSLGGIVSQHFLQQRNKTGNKQTVLCVLT